MVRTRHCLRHLHVRSQPLAARFLQQVLGDLSAWHADQALYNKEAIGEHLPGFQMRWGARHGGEPIPQADFCPFESFRQVHSKWHTVLKTVRPLASHAVSLC